MCTSQCLPIALVCLTLFAHGPTALVYHTPLAHDGSGAPRYLTLLLCPITCTSTPLAHGSSKPPRPRGLPILYLMLFPTPPALPKVIHTKAVDVLKLLGLPTMTALLSQKRLRWVGHALRRDDGDLSKTEVKSELALSSKPWTKCVLSDMESLGIQTVGSA